MQGKIMGNGTRSRWRPVVVVLVFALVCVGIGAGMPFIALLFHGSGGPTAVPWTAGSWTQPVPAWGSPVRLALPVPLDRIVIRESTAFGVHRPGHAEGLDHIWLSTTADAIIGSWAPGRVSKIEWAETEYHVTIDYGQGLIGRHMEVERSFVKLGDEVAEGTPVAIGMENSPGTRSAEFALVDMNRRDGVLCGRGAYVSPFDYLRDDVRAAFLQKYLRDVVESHFNRGKDLAGCKRWEPYLTNRVLIHKDHRGTVAGEWLLTRQWSVPGEQYFDILTLLDVTNEYGSFRSLAAQDERDSRPSFQGSWNADYARGRITFESDGEVYYGIFQLDESRPRAELKLEYQPDSYPTQFSTQAATYIERAPVSRREDARNLGVL